MSKEKYSNTDKDSKAYAAGYDVFLKRTNFREVINLEFDKLIRESKFHSYGASIRILDLGCGNGNMTQRYVNSILNVFKEAKIELDLVEPAKGALDDAKKCFEGLGLRVNAQSVSAEDFARDLGELEKFYDIIICSYIFYHVSTDIIRPLTERLSEQGVMMISMGSNEHPLRKHPSLRAASKHGDSNIIENAISQDSIDKDFLVLKHALKTDLNLSGLMENGILNAEGEIFFSFIYNTDLEKFSAEQMDALKSTITETYLNSHGVVHPVHNMYWLTRSEV